MKYLSLLAVILLLPVWAVSQEFIENEATKAYGNYSFNEVINLNKSLVDDGNRNRIVLEELANAYFFNADYKLAGYYYSMLFSDFDSLPVNDVYRYYQTLRVDGQYQQADKLVRHYCSLSDAYNHQLTYLLTDSLVQKAVTYNIRKIDYNSSQSEFVTSFYSPDRVFISSARDTGMFEHRVHRWNNKSFLDIYLANIDFQTGEIQKLKKLSRAINSKYHESTTAFNSQTKTLYFTQNRVNRSTKKGKDILRLSIFQTIENDDGKWQVPQELPFCSDRFSVANPALSPDGKRLYFSSDMPGGFGNSDLYYVELVNGNVHGAPVNLGGNINTVGRETFPFINRNDVLYFASDSRRGYGGLDLYEAQRKPDETYGKPINMGETINSTADDFCFIVNTGGDAGYFASNRNNPASDDDIYYFTVTPVDRCLLNIHGQVTDARSGENITGVAIHLFDETMKKLVEQTETNDAGKYKVAVDCVRSIEVRYEKSGYKAADSIIPIQSGTTDFLVDIKLEGPILPDVNEEKTIPDTLQFQPVYFGFDQSIVTDATTTELEKIIQVLHEYPKLKIQIISYADSRGDKDYNYQLSKKRSEAIASYIIEHGTINSDRLVPLGRGAVQLQYSGIIPEKIHQENRRTEFKIITD